MLFFSLFNTDGVPMQYVMTSNNAEWTTIQRVLLTTGSRYWLDGEDRGQCDYNLLLAL